MHPAALLLLLFLQQTDPYAEGMKALEAKKYDEAVSLFTKAADADPKDYAARFHLALAQSMTGKDVEATAGYRKVLEMKPGLYQAELNLGILLLRRELASEAIPPLEAAVEQKPREYRPVFYLAQALVAAGKWPEAEARYKTAAELDPKSAAAQAGWGRALTKQDHLEEAAEHYQKAAELDPSFKDAMLELAGRFEDRKQMPQAIAIYQKFPENAAARERLGELLLESGAAAEAIPQLEAVYKSSPTPANRLALATAYLRNKQPQKGLALLQQSVAAEPNQLELRMMYGRALRDQKLYTAAANEFFHVTKIQADHKEAWSELAASLILSDNYPQALEALDSLQALGVENAANYYFRAIILDKLKQLKPALQNYEKFLAMSQGQHPDEEFKARQRARIIKNELNKR